MKLNRHRIKFPKKSFLKEARQEYSGSLSRRILLELIQNSVDAKSTIINFIYNSETHTLTCEDDGVGMDKDTLVKAQLTFSGSKKLDGNTGFFGASKKIVLFSSKSYQIHTRDLKAVGININFRLYENTDFRNGTKIKIKMFQPEIEKDFEKQLKYIIDRSWFTAKVYFNGKLYETKFSMPETNTETGFISNSPFPNQISVRLGGLYSFDFQTNSKKGYFYDVAGSSKDAFTQNREGFQIGTKFRKDFEGFYSQINNNTLSGIDAEIKYKKSRATVTDFYGIEISGCDIPVDFKPGKKHKMLFSYCKALAEMVGINLKKQDFGFYFDESVRGLCANGKVYVNPNAFNDEKWETNIISTFFHELLHSRLPLRSNELIGISGGNFHDERMISEFGELWNFFMTKYSGINPIKSRMREIEKIEF